MTVATDRRMTLNTKSSSYHYRSALTLNPSPLGRGTLNSCSLLPLGEGLGMRAVRQSFLYLFLIDLV
jgi:hypothetical protein